MMNFLIIGGGAAMVLLAAIAGVLGSFRDPKKRHWQQAGYVLTGTWLTLACGGSFLIAINQKVSLSDLTIWAISGVLALAAHCAGFAIRRSYSKYRSPFIE
jgi:hypothetical protein